MYIVAGIICFLIFLYSLHVLGKDDYILIRKNLTLEHFFDFVFLGVISGLIFSGLFTAFIHPQNLPGFASRLFSSSGSGFTLTGFVVACLISFYTIGKLQRIPLAHLFDFLALSFTSSLPMWYLSGVLISKNREAYFYLGLAIYYLIIHLVFRKYLLPKINKNKLKEGSVSSLFIILFSLASLISSIIFRLNYSKLQISGEDFLLSVLFIVGVVIFLRNERKRTPKINK